MDFLVSLIFREKKIGINKSTHGVSIIMVST